MKEGIIKKVKEYFTVASKATGTKVKITVGENAYETFRPNYPLAEAFKKNLR